MKMVEEKNSHIFWVKHGTDFYWSDQIIFFSKKPKTESGGDRYIVDNLCSKRLTRYFPALKLKKDKIHKVKITMELLD